MTTNITLLFPGQGSQYVGMGKKFEGKKCFDTFDQANDVLGYNLSKIIFEGPENELQMTYNAQPAILTYSVVLLRRLKEIIKTKNVKIDHVLGHSLGEYSALVSAGTLSFEDAVKAVHIRGQFMQDAVPKGVGKMIAVMKVPQEKIIEACKQASNNDEKVMPANFNEPNQIVISGNAKACDRAVMWLNENIEGRLRAIELKVSAPFHSSYMEPAAKRLKDMLEAFPFNENTIPYIANINANEYSTETEPETIRKNLVKQVTGTVMWTQSIQKLNPKTLCLEVGPGKVLAGLVRKINPDIKVISLDRETAFSDIEEIFS